MNIEEVRKAAEQWASSEKEFLTREVAVIELANHRINERTLAKWAAKELARRDAEAAERALPITREWLRSLGFERCKDDLYPNSEGNDNERWRFNGGCLRLWPFNGKCWLIHGCDGFDIKTRGQINDLLAALKGGES